MGIPLLLLNKPQKKNVPTYIDKVLSLRPLAFWPLNEASGTIAYDRSGNGYNGVVVNALVNQNGTYPCDKCYSFDGTGDAVNLYSARLAGAFNGDEMTVAGWLSVTPIAWTDGTLRYIFIANADASNLMYIRRQTTNNALAVVRVGGGTSDALGYTTTGPSSFFHVTSIVSVSGNYMRFFIDGSQVAADATGFLSYSGSPTSTGLALGASNSTGSSSLKGKMGNWGLWNTPLSHYDIARLALCSGYVVFDGDSRTVGVATPYPVVAMTTASVVAKRYGWQNIAVSGQTWANMTSDIASDLGPLSGLGKPIVVAWSGVNDAMAALDAAAIHTNLAAYCTAARALGYKVIVCTEIDGQSAGLNAVNWNTTIWPALNTLINANWTTYADGLADLGGNANLQDATNTTYFNADQVHLVQAGLNEVAAIVAAAIAAL